MKRHTVATVAIAAVVGLAGGSVAAIVRGGSDLGDAAAGNDQAEAPRVGQLLYADTTSIHDGDLVVRHGLAVDGFSRLVRAADGWLVGVAAQGRPEVQRVWHVDLEGGGTEVAELRAGWDLDPTGRRVVGVDASSRQVTARTLDGEVLGTARGVDRAQAAVWRTDRDVVLSSLRGSGSDRYWRSWRWPVGGRAVAGDEVAMEGMTASRDGGLVMGSVSAEGGAYGTSNPCLGVSTTPGAQPDPRGEYTSTLTCDWRPEYARGAAFSPSGELVKVIDSRSDGFGPGRFAVFPAREGVTAGLRLVDSPADWTLGSQWLDDAHLVVSVAADADAVDSGTVLFRCDLTGECQEAARSDEGPLVAGEQY